jgi:hypothetical protein
LISPVTFFLGAISSFPFCLGFYKSLVQWSDLLETKLHWSLSFEQ